LSGQSGEIYNIGSGELISNFEIATILVESFGGNMESIEYVSDRLGHDFRYSLDSTKLSKKTEFSTKIKLKQFLESAFD
jgi:dTDP-glucose 4,6-dehydratase